MGVGRRITRHGVHGRRDRHARSPAAGSTPPTTDGNGTVDRGYWQVNSIHGALSTYDPAGNARAAVQLSGDGTNWSPWVTYQTGAYQGQC